jgi:alkylation response protein AidB-like acyl-CoA dehydrogenase
MADYLAPLADMRFVLEKLVDLPALQKLNGYQHVDHDLVTAVLDEGARFVQDLVAPLNRVGDTAGSRLGPDDTVLAPPGFAEAYSRYVEAGWGGVDFPAEWGGHGMPKVIGMAFEEMLTSANLSFSLCPLLTFGAIDALVEHGSDEQKALYLPKLISGEWSATMNLTEPHAGSDVGALSTKAVRQDDGTYRISGSKIFITWGEHEMAHNIVHLVLARTPDAPAGTRGISMFIVPKFLPDDAGGPGKRNDLKVVSLEHKLGIHASPTCVMSFGETHGAIGYLLGEEHQGMRNMFTMMNAARVSVGLQGLAIAERAYQDAVAYARERIQGRAVGGSAPSPIIEHPDVRRMLMTMRANIEAMRAVMYTTAEHEDHARHAESEDDRAWHHDAVALFTPVVKAWGTDLGVALTSLAVQVHGGMGFVEETGVAQHFRDSRIAPIYEGTNGVQAIDLVMRKLPLRDGAFVSSIVDTFAAEAQSLRTVEGFEAAEAALGSAIEALRGATEWLLAARHDPNQALAGATPYCTMFGIVAGGALLARSALVGDEAKRSVARFYLEQILPTAHGLVPSITAGAADLFAISPDAL